MHQKHIKSNFLQHHSIPILLVRSIPIGCVVALLFVILGLNHNVAYAAPECSDYGLGNADGYTWISDTDGMMVCHDYKPILTEPSTVIATPSLSLSIDNGQSSTSEKIMAKYGEPNYSSHTVKVSASGVKAYTLTLSNAKVTGPTNLTGVSNTVGSNLGNNVWGYGWGSTSTTDANLTYNSSTSSNLTGDGVSNNRVDFSRKLTFVTKFDENASDGTYHASATLSLTATPAELTYVPWNKMVYMQDMTPEACDSVSVGATATLADIRDDSTYTVGKLADGKCWMTQNLRITGDSAKLQPNSQGSVLADSVLLNSDSDVSEDFYLPNSSMTGFSDDAAVNVYYGGDTTYGAYYTWCAATAGTCSSAATNNTDAPSSICPKGWRLPKGTPGTGTNEFAVVVGLTGTNIAVNADYWNNLTDKSFANGALAVDGITWPAAGAHDSNSVNSVGFNGSYWSSTVYDSTNASRLFLYDGSFRPANKVNRRFGFSVRCVAR